MPDAPGIESHQPRTGEVHRHRIVGENELASLAVCPVKRPLPSIAIIPSAMTNRTGTVAHISRMLR